MTSRVQLTPTRTPPMLPKRNVSFISHPLPSDGRTATGRPPHSTALCSRCHPTFSEPTFSCHPARRRSRLDISRRASMAASRSAMA